MSAAAWKRGLKAVARRFGVDLVRFRPEASEPAHLQAVLQHLGVDLVFDVGANEGQYALSLRDAGYRGRIVSFEPLAEAHARLAARAARDPAWAVPDRCALGDVDGEVTINVAGNGVSSSVLPMLARHADAAPHSRYVATERVPLRRLDGVAGGHLGDARGVFLKVDTQGFEGPVLRGAPQLLQRCRALQLELSLVPLYEGQELWDHFVGWLGGMGFVVWTVFPGFVEAATGRTLQIDAVFVRR